MFYSLGHFLLMMCILYGPAVVGAGLVVFGLFKHMPILVGAAIAVVVIYYIALWFLFSRLVVQ